MMRYGSYKTKPGEIINRFTEGSSIREELKQLSSDDIKSPDRDILFDDADTARKKEISKTLMDFDKKLKRK